METRNYTEFWQGNLLESVYLEDKEAGRTVTLRWIFRREVMRAQGE
jgi:hypothetical protein